MMKRKLDANDIPAPSEEPKEVKEKATFATFGLDSRILQAIAKENFQAPTLVQTKAIPLALNGHDILARAKTGSGKTAAYLLPILNSVLKRKQVRSLLICSKNPANTYSLLERNALPPLSSYRLANLQSKSLRQLTPFLHFVQSIYEPSISHKKSLTQCNDPS